MIHLQAQKLRELYARIPPFICKPGCTACCGPVVMSRLEADRLPQKFATPPALKCQFAEGGHCSVYSKRPLICRLFGASDHIPCPYGCGPSKRLTAEQSHTLMAEYIEIVGPRPVCTIGVDSPLVEVLGAPKAIPRPDLF